MSTAVRWSPARSPGVAGALIVMGSQVLAGVVALRVIDTPAWVLATQSVTGIFVALWLVALGICPAAPPPEVHELFLSPFFWVNPVILGPIVEELTFRGFLFDWLLKWGRTTAVVVSALVATLLHGYPSLYSPRFPGQSAILSRLRRTVVRPGLQG
ncbi:MAG: CPBP family intramembrane metalloprotease [Firmicutes bacterium]|nr:CPBP family intramembrane metalloprotease [Bacillota bacterium]